jgi:hypothetical protein
LWGLFIDLSFANGPEFCNFQSMLKIATASVLVIVGLFTAFAVFSSMTTKPEEKVRNLVNIEECRETLKNIAAMYDEEVWSPLTYEEKLELVGSEGEYATVMQVMFAVSWLDCGPI